MLCYLRPFMDMRLSLIGRISYTMANYGWVIGMLLWALVSYVMIGWIVFQVSIVRMLEHTASPCAHNHHNCYGISLAVVQHLSSL